MNLPIKNSLLTSSINDEDYDDKALECFGEFACLNFPLYGA